MRARGQTVGLSGRGRLCVAHDGLGQDADELQGGATGDATGVCGQGVFRGGSQRLGLPDDARISTLFARQCERLGEHGGAESQLGEARQQDHRDDDTETQQPDAQRDGLAGVWAGGGVHLRRVPPLTVRRGATEPATEVQEILSVWFHGHADLPGERGGGGDDGERVRPRTARLCDHRRDPRREGAEI